jgi:hypothetical protein
MKMSRSLIYLFLIPAVLLGGSNCYAQVWTEYARSGGTIFSMDPSSVKTKGHLRKVTVAWLKADSVSVLPIVRQVWEIDCYEDQVRLLEFAMSPTEVVSSGGVPAEAKFPDAKWLSITSNTPNASLLRLVCLASSG